MLDRRGFLTGLVVLVAAPAVVRVESIMPVRRPPLIIPNYTWFEPRDLYQAISDWEELVQWRKEWYSGVSN